MSKVSSTSSNTLSSLSTKTGIGGLISGMDTDELVESLSSGTKNKITKQQQKLQKLEWKQTSYRTVNSALTDFKRNYFNVLSDTNFSSPSFFNTVKASTTSTDVSVSATGDASEGSLTIDSITQLATAQKISSTKSATNGITLDFAGSYLSRIENKSLTLSLDGKVKTITFDSDFMQAAGKDGANFQNALQSAVTTAFGKNGETPLVGVSLSEGRLSLNAEGSTLKVDAVNKDTDTLTALGLTSGQSNKLNTSTQLGLLSFNTKLSNSESGVYKFTINSVDFEFKDTVSLSTIMNKINSSKAGVTISYSDINDKFSITADDTGSGSNIVIGDTDGNMLAAFGLTEKTGAVSEAGKNAILSVNGQAITRSTNNFTINGVKLELLSTTKADAAPIKVAMNQDSGKLKEPIKKFVAAYNTMIELINTYVKEDVHADYVPLSDEEKADMTEGQIEKWEEKAKSGILRGDSILKGIASKMQAVMYSSIEKGGISLHDLGISSAGYQENGKLKIDEKKLDAALETRGAEITELFTADKGLSDQFESIINGATKTSGVRGSRGTLVEAAGVADTSSVTQNSIHSDITDINDYIKDLKSKLEKEQKRYWAKFTSMETALSNLNSQSSMITSFGAK